MNNIIHYNGSVEMASTAPRIDLECSIVVPVYRGTESIVELTRRLTTALESANVSFEIVFVDDRGNAGNWPLIKSLCATNPGRVRGIRLSRNFGQHAATLCGIFAAKGDWVVTIDEDLEQPPDAVPKLLAKAREGFDVVYGVNKTRTHSWWRNFTSDVGRALFKLAIPSLNRDYTSFRAIHRSVAQELKRFQSPFTFIDGYISWITHNYATVEVKHDVRFSGRSSYNLRRLVAHMINIFVTFSDLPLRIATWMGIGASSLGALWGISIIASRLAGNAAPSGYASLMAVITFLCGVQLLILGVFGEYLARINFKTTSMPLFLVEQES